MTDIEAKLKCLELACTVASRSAINFADAIVEISTQFYNHINMQSIPVETKPPGLTARGDKQKK